MSTLRVTGVSRYEGKIHVSLRRTPGWLASLFGRKSSDETYWTRDSVYWYSQSGREVSFREWPDRYNLNEWVREHDARVELFGHELA